MSARTIVLRRAARLDIDQAIDFYVENEAPGAAHRFVDELEVAFEHLARFPESGSLRYAQELRLGFGTGLYSATRISFSTSRATTMWTSGVSFTPSETSPSGYAAGDRHPPVAKNTNTERSSVISTNRCSLSFPTYSTDPGSTAIRSPSTSAVARPEMM